MSGKVNGRTVFGEFATANWVGRRPVDAFPEFPYPGERPSGSYVVRDGQVRGLDLGGGGWIDREAGEVVSLDGLVFVLAYGSNPNPKKLSEKLGGTVLVLRCHLRNHAAVWCDARRRAGKVVATIVSDPGHIEEQHVLAVSERQLGLIDAWEGHPFTYERQQMPTGSVLLESGELPAEMLVYVGTSERRPALQIDGQYWRTSEHPYAEVDALLRSRHGGDR